jgi:putative SOS response-associated peptidase YedK
MTALLRCRGSLAEIATLFSAEAPEQLAWTPNIWPGETVLTVVGGTGGRRIEAMTWGLPADAFVDPKRAKARRTALFGRDLTSATGKLGDPAALRRCLIVLEAFAYPDGPPGEKIRAWAGLWDTPLAAWAGVWSGGGAEAGCAGLLIAANERVGEVSRHMPVLLASEDHDSWLYGPGWLLATKPIVEDAAFYLERTGEAWSTGQPLDERG